MSASNLDIFVRKIMDIYAMTTGMGSASAGIMGTAGMGDETIRQLKKCAMAFANEYSKQAQNKTVLEELSGQIRGSLQTLAVISAISGKQCDQLLDELHNLTARL